MKKEMIISAPSKELAAQSAESRLPASIKRAQAYKIIIKDLGVLKEHKVWFSSDISSNVVSTPDFSDINREIMDLFHMLWGEEIGWRTVSTEPGSAEAKILAQLKNETKRQQLLAKWADEYLSLESEDAEEFFKKKLADHLQTNISNLQDMTPISSTEYNRIVKTAQKEANRILQDAKTEADIIRDNANAQASAMISIANALQQGVQPTLQVVQAAAPQPEQTLPSNPDEDKQPEQQEEASEVYEMSEEEYRDEFGEDDESVYSDGNYDSDDISDDVFVPADEFPPEQDLDAMADAQSEEDSNAAAPAETVTEETPAVAEQPTDKHAEPVQETAATPPPVKELPDEELMELMMHYKPELLQQALSDLSIRAKNQKTGRWEVNNAQIAINNLFSIPDDVSEYDLTRCLLEIIRVCEPKNTVKPLQYVYNKYAIDESDDNETM